MRSNCRHSVGALPIYFHSQEQFSSILTQRPQRSQRKRKTLLLAIMNHSPNVSLVQATKPFPLRPLRPLREVSSVPSCSLLAFCLGISLWGCDHRIDPSPCLKFGCV